MKPTATTLAVILAAGSGSRMGSHQCKQLLPIAGKPLLQHVIDAAVNSRCSHVLTVLGAHEERIRGSISFNDTTTISNPIWCEGISSSIRTAVRHAQSQPFSIDAAVFLLGDQPLITSATIDRLLDKLLPGQPCIAASRYRGCIGVPTVFGAHHFAELLQLHGDIGARVLLRKYQDTISTIDLDENFDIDTNEDYERVLSSQSVAN